MSFVNYRKKLIEENDLVILYISFNKLVGLKVTKTLVNKKGSEVENVYQTPFGALKVWELIGVPFGSRVPLSNGTGFIHVLHPTPELWTKCLPHRTQILYANDISMIILNLDLKPGSVVVESGTGSGSLSHSILRTIRRNNGHLHTFDFHQDRVEAATKEFIDHGFDKNDVTCCHRDVCTDGFDLDNVADAVFLDLPHPWLALPHAKKALKKTSQTRLCSFSPCIEQVQKTCDKMRELNFIEIQTIEILLREFQVRKISMPVYDPDYTSSYDENKYNNKDENGKDDNDGEPCLKKSKIEQVEKSETVEKDKKEMQPDKHFLTGLPCTSMAGHTGYLTFATLPPST